MRPKPFRRSASNRVVAGVCGGLAQRLGLNPGLVRIGAALVILVSNGYGLLAYLLAWALIPSSRQRLSPWERRGVRWNFGKLVPLAGIVGLWLLLIHGGGVTWLLVVIAVVSFFAWQLGRRQSRGRRLASRAAGDHLTLALAQWQYRLEQVRSQAETNAAPPTLPSSLSESLALAPETTAEVEFGHRGGFIPGQASLSPASLAARDS